MCLSFDIFSTYTYLRFNHYQFSLSFYFTDTSTPHIYTLSLHDALPIYSCVEACAAHAPRKQLASNSQRLPCADMRTKALEEDRKSTRLNSSHRCISYAVFCLKKKRFR